MQVFRCRDLINLKIICVQIEAVLSLIRENWMLWLVGAGSKLALLVAALLPRGCVWRTDPAPTNQPTTTSNSLESSSTQSLSVHK